MQQNKFYFPISIKGYPIIYFRCHTANLFIRIAQHFFLEIAAVAAVPLPFFAEIIIKADAERGAVDFVALTCSPKLPSL